MLGLSGDERKGGENNEGEEDAIVCMVSLPEPCVTATGGAGGFRRRGGGGGGGLFVLVRLRGGGLSYVGVNVEVRGGAIGETGTTETVGRDR